MQSNKTVILFLVKFFGSYLILFLCYSFYLSKTQKTVENFRCAPITQTVAEQTNYLLNSLGYVARNEQHTKEVSVLLFVDDKPIARIIEGCNSISIIILFIAFIIAFSSTFKATFIYILFGSLFLYFINVIRIVIITIALVKFPEQEKLIHNYIFPVIIYGVVLLLWFLWIKKFSKLNE